MDDRRTVKNKMPQQSSTFLNQFQSVQAINSADPGRTATKLPQKPP
jgi:hypothetical protein